MNSISDVAFSRLGSRGFSGSITDRQYDYLESQLGGGGGPATPTLINSWGRVGIDTDNNLGVEITQTIPVGTLLIAASNASSISASTPGVTSVACVPGNTWNKGAHSLRVSTHDTNLWYCLTSVEIPAGTFITTTWPSTNTRKAVIVAAFSGVTANRLAHSGDDVDMVAAASNNWNGSDAVPIATVNVAAAGLVVGVCALSGTRTLTPAAEDTLVGQLSTTTGSSDRGVALVYRNDADNEIQTVTGTYSSTGGWAAASIVLGIATGGGGNPITPIGTSYTDLQRSIIPSGRPRLILQVPEA